MRDQKAKLQQTEQEVHVLKSGRDMLERQFRQTKDSLDQANQYVSQLERNQNSAQGSNPQGNDNRRQQKQPNKFGSSIDNSNAFSQKESAVPQINKNQMHSKNIGSLLAWGEEEMPSQAHQQPKRTTWQPQANDDDGGSAIAFPSRAKNNVQREPSDMSGGGSNQWRPRTTRPPVDDDSEFIAFPSRVQQRQPEPDAADHIEFPSRKQK